MREPAFRHVLVPTDGSEASIQAAQRAIQLLAGSNGRLTALSVVDDLVVRELARFGGRPETEARAEMARHGARYVDLVREDAAREHVAAGTLVRHGNPFEEIVAAAAEVGADLIAMGHVGRRGAGQFLMGSVTSHVLDYAPCPVLVVKAPATQAA